MKNKFMMKTESKLSAARFVPAVLLVLTILLLALILASLSRKGLKREEKLLFDLKETQARTLVRSIASASRISAMLEEGGRHLDRFIADTAQDEDLAFIAVYESRKETLIASPGFNAEEYGLVLPEVRRRLSDAEYTSSVETFGEAGRIFLHIGRFNPLDSPWVHLKMLEIPTIPGVIERPELDGEDMFSYVIIGMSTDDLDKAVSKGMRQALLNGFLLLLLGTVGFYFFIIVQGYYSARRALADFRLYTLDVIQGMAQGFINIDNRGTLRTINPEAETILDIKARDYLGKNWSELFTRGSWEGLARLLESRNVSYEMEVEPSEPGKPHLKVTLIPVRGHAGTQGRVLFLRDMGEVKGLQAEIRRTERLAALGRLVAGLAHEIRNPLNSISGFSQHLKKKFNPESSEGKAVDVIVREVERLNRVITDLLDFSRPREPEMERVDLNDVVRSTGALVEREAAGQGVTIVTEADEKGVPVTGNSDSLKQLLLNLILNSFQAMPDGGILTIQTGTSGRRPFLSINDTGTGIEESDHEKIFEPFFTTRDTGTGIGLAIVHRIVLDHGGDIRVESIPGSGATFRVRFPEIGAD
jgi:two-component system sensor histidine kinase HydH